MWKRSMSMNYWAFLYTQPDRTDVSSNMNISPADDGAWNIRVSLMGSDAVYLLFTLEVIRYYT